MRNLLIALLALAACKTTEHQAKTTSPTTPRVGRVSERWEVVDKADGTRVGFVEKTVYDDGRWFYWVVDKDDFDVKYGYILGNNSAYKYPMHAGRRASEAESIGADTISSNARRILGYERPVELRRSSLQAQMDELRAKQAARHKKQMGGAGAGAGDGDSDGEDADNDDE